MMTKTKAPATEKQVAFAMRLIAERIQDPEGEAQLAMQERLVAATKAEASAIIDGLLSMPKPYKAQENAPTEQGIYRTEDGTVYKVQQARSSGNFYAKRLNVETQKFEYEAGAIRKVTAADRLTLEQAKEFGHQFGVCINCAATLTDPKSVEAGIGPVCAKRFE